MPSSYHGGTQNWDITTYHNNIVLFANNTGLVTYHNEHWNHYPVGQGGAVRSLAVTGDTIWVGGTNEFGYFVPDLKQGLRFVSLSNQDEKNMGSFWNIYFLPDRVVFQAEYALHVWHKKKKKIQIHKSEDRIWTGLIHNHKLHLSVGNKLVTYTPQNNKLNTLATTHFLKNREVRAIINKGSTFYLFALDGGVITYKEGRYKELNHPSILTKYKVFSVQPVGSSFYVGTIANGLLALDSNLNLIKQWNMKSGMPDNTVLSIHYDGFNLWAGLDYGIAKIIPKKPMKNLWSDGRAYSILNTKKGTYLGTNIGAYWGTDNNFKLLNGTLGQVWNLKKIGGAVLCCHNNGLYLFDSKKATLIFERSGVFDIQQINKDDALISTYGGLYRIDLNTYKYTKIKGNYSSPRWLFILPEQPKQAWGQANDVTQKFIFSSDYDSVIERKMYDILPRFTYLHMKQDKLYAFTHENVYLYQGQTDSFIQVKKAPFSLLPLGLVQRVIEGDKNMFFVVDEKIYMAERLKDNSWALYDRLFSLFDNQMVKNSNYIHLHNNQLIILTYNGYFLYDAQIKEHEYNSLKKPLLKKITFFDEKREQKYIPLYFSSFKEHKGISTYLTNFHFDLTNTSDNRTYVKLIGQDSIPLKDLQYRHYTNLAPGDYVLEISSFDNTTQNFKKQTIPLTIIGQWYQSAWVKVVAVILILALQYFIVLLSRFYHQKKQKKQMLLKEKEQLSFQISEQNEKILLLGYELTRNKEFFTRLQELLKEKEGNKRLLKMIKRFSDAHTDLLINEQLKVSNWKFVKRLQERHPKLSPADIRLTLLLKINLDSKSIGSILNISPRSVNMARYRLRIKLGLKHGDTLADYFRSFDDEKQENK